MTTTFPEKIRDIQSELNVRYPQRTDAIDVVTLAILSRKHGFLLGPPGTAKSQLIREVVDAFPGARYFEALLSKNRPDAAVLGPYNIAELREHSNFVRKDAGFLTTSDIVFLDEVGKMSPTLGHDLLGALNERVKHEVSDERSTHTIPLRTALTASNEHPAAESEDAAALWDRLDLRAQVDYLQTATEFGAMLTAIHAPFPDALKVPYEALATMIDPEIAEVIITDDTIDAVLGIRQAMRNEGIIISDRRWRSALDVTKAAAWLRGAKETDVEDLDVLRLMLWDDASSYSKVHRTILGVTAPQFADVLEMADVIAEVEHEIPSLAKLSNEKMFGKMKDLHGRISEIIKRLTAIQRDATSDRHRRQIDAQLDACKNLTAQIQAAIMPPLA